MQITAQLKYLRISPRKVRLAADLIRRKETAKAEKILQFTNKKAAGPLLKLLKSALANAKNNFQLDPENLRIAKVLVDEGPKLKRWRPRARGRAYEIQKKSSHITIVLEEIEAKKEPVKKEVAKEEKPKLIKPLKKKAKAEKEEKKTEEKKEIKREAKKEVKRVKPIERRKIRKPKIQRGIKRIFRRKAFG